MYFADLDPTSGSLHALKSIPLQIKTFRLSIPPSRDIEWIQQTLDGRCQQFGTRVILDSERQLVVIGPRAETYLWSQYPPWTAFGAPAKERLAKRNPYPVDSLPN